MKRNHKLQFSCFGSLIICIIFFTSGKKLEDGKCLGGRGRLTATRIDTLQNLYRKAIRDNKGNAKAMSKATHAILKHSSSTPEQCRHEDCPVGRSLWQNTHVPIKDPLPEPVVKVMAANI